MAVVDRNILRAGRVRAALAATVPPKVAINEAIEIAKKFGTPRLRPVHQRHAGPRPQGAARRLLIGAAVRYALLSDIHGNLEALEAVLADAASRADGILCLGDIVGYGADPGPCIERVAERAQAVVAGNHEHGVAGLAAARLVQRPRADRGPVDAGPPGSRPPRAGSRRGPLVAEIDDATLVHASPAHPADWDYVISAEDGLRRLRGVHDAHVLHRPLASPGRVVDGLVGTATGRRAPRRSTSRRAAATSSTSAASASRATAIRARPTPCGTSTPGG